MVNTVDTKDTNRKIKEDKYKILRMSIILSNDHDADVISDFETSSREIDSINQELFEEEIKKKYYDTSSLEEEKSRLESLTTIIEKRCLQRDALKEDFYNVTRSNLTGLEPIRDEEKLQSYKDRLMYITEYLDNLEKISELESLIDDYNKKLALKNEDMERNSSLNVSYEKELLSHVKKIIPSSISSLKSEAEIEEKLFLINSVILDSKKTLDIFNKAYISLKKAGITDREDREYYSYFENARNDYYDKMEEYFYIVLYKLCLNIFGSYDDIYNKRNRINEIISDRKSLRSNLEVNGDDSFESLESLLNSQFSVIKSEIDVINEIDDINKDISLYREKLDNYNASNEKFEIVSLLKEYHILPNDDILESSNSDFDFDISDNDSFDVKKDDSGYDDIIDISLNNDETSNVELEIKDNEIINVEDSSSLDIISARDKAHKVMARVGRMFVNSLDSNDDNSDKDSFNVEDKDSNDEIVLPSFDDLPTVSSLTSGSSTSGSNSSFWGDAEEFSFPDLNDWGNM